MSTNAELGKAFLAGEFHKLVDFARTLSAEKFVDVEVLLGQMGFSEIKLFKEGPNHNRTDCEADHIYLASLGGRRYRVRFWGSYYDRERDALANLCQAEVIDHKSRKEIRPENADFFPNEDWSNVELAGGVG